MQMEIEAAGDRLTARIKGELDHHSAAQARAQLDALLTDERIRELRIDLRGLTFMDSSGLGVILGRYRVIAGRGGRVLIGGANRAIDRILRMAAGRAHGYIGGENNGKQRDEHNFSCAFAQRGLCTERGGGVHGAA